MGRHVKGVLFRDYVRMLRAQPEPDRSPWLRAEDLPFLQETVDARAWYPIETFERLGLAILDRVAHGDLDLVRRWGRTSAAHVAAVVDDLVVPGDPRESLMRFQVFRRGFFDFEAVAVLALSDGLAELEIAYGMCAEAEQAAAVQTMGFFEGLIELADGADIEAAFLERSWLADPRTRLRVSWSQPTAPK